MANKNNKIHLNLSRAEENFSRKNDGPTAEKALGTELNEEKIEEVKEENNKKEKDKKKKDSEKKTPARVVGKAGRPRARIYNDKGTKPMCFNVPLDVKDTLDMCAFFGKVSQSDIVRTALDEFLRNNTKDNKLTDEGISKVREFVENTSIE